MLRHMVRIFTILSCLCLSCAALAAETDRALYYAARAERDIAQSDWDNAFIEIKNAVQQNSKNGRVRYLAGQITLHRGDYEAAENHFRIAAANGYNPAEIDAGLAEVHVKQERYGEVLDDVEADDRAAPIESRVRSARGYAYFGLQRIRDAERSFQEAMDLNEHNALALAGMGRVDAAKSKNAEAETLLQRAVQEDPALSEAWLLLGYVRLWQGHPETARQPFDKAVELTPDSEPARRARALLLIDSEPDKAAEDVAVMLDQNPNSKVGNFLDALAKSRHGDIDDAESALQNIPDIDDYPPALFLYARLNFLQGKLQEAEEHLKKLLTLTPNDQQGQMLRAAVFMRLANFPPAIVILEALRRAGNEEPAVLSMLADAYTAVNDQTKAADVLSRIAQLPKLDVDARTKLALQQSRIGKLSDAEASLLAARSAGPLPMESASLLVGNYLEQKKFDEAWKAAEEARDAAPNDANAQVLLGLVALRRDGSAASIPYFQKALQLDPGLAVASVDLAGAYRLAGEVSQARDVLDRAVKRDPKNVDVMLARADLERAQHAATEEITWLERARAASGTAAAPRFRLVTAYLDRNESGKAVTVATELEQIAEDDPQAIAAVGQAQLANKEMENAINSFQRLANLTKDSTPALVQLAHAYAVANDQQDAGLILRKALSQSPDDLSLQSTVIEFASRTQQTSAFVALAEELAQKRPDDTRIGELRATLLLADGRNTDAVSAFTEAYSKGGSERAAIGLARAQATVNDIPAGIGTLREWLARNPNDVQGRFLLAQLLNATKQYDAAISEYETLSKQPPPNPLVLNDLAWLYQTKGDPRALSTAQEAHRLAPDVVTISDTLGWILVQQGETEAGLKLLEAANAQSDAATPSMKYRLAVALERLGRHGEARTALDGALAAGTPFAEANDARALRDKIGN
jgi:putative PEP-CTERM system TPR-repeat lipoprotein